MLKNDEGNEIDPKAGKSYTAMDGNVTTHDCDLTNSDQEDEPQHSQATVTPTASSKRSCASKQAGGKEKKSKCGYWAALMTVSISDFDIRHQLDFSTNKVPIIACSQDSDISIIEQDARRADLSWRPPNPFGGHAGADDIQKNGMALLRDPNLRKKRNYKFAFKVRNVQREILKKNKNIKSLYPLLRLKDKNFYLLYLDTYADEIEELPYIADMMSWQGLYAVMQGITERDAKFLHRIGQYTPELMSLRVIADLERETYTFVTEFDEYHDTFFKDGGNGGGFLD